VTYLDAFRQEGSYEAFRYLDTDTSSILRQLIRTFRDFSRTSRVDNKNMNRTSQLRQLYFIFAVVN